MEDAADRTQAFTIVGRLAPHRQQLAEVADLFLEFLQENLANLVVDVAAVLEATHGHLRRFIRSHRRLDRRHHFDRHHQRKRRSHVGLDRFRQFKWHCDLAGRRRDSLQFRQRPVTQVLQTLARDIEDVLAVRTLVAQCFQVVLKAGQGVG